jgi:SAM-dependent methyltransferase
VNAGQRVARFITDAVVRRPALWRLFRSLIRRQFDRLAPSWDAMRSTGHLESLEVALDAVRCAPRRILARWPEADVVGVDVAEGMLTEARRLLPPDLAGRVRFEHADASALPFADGSFDLVTLSNMIPFFDEIDRVLVPGGQVAFIWSVGDQTPIYVPPERLRAELGRRGFGEFRELEAEPGTAFLARKPDRG